jgi:hypothetical protein
MDQVTESTATENREVSLPEFAVHICEHVVSSLQDFLINLRKEVDPCSGFRILTPIRQIYDALTTKRAIIDLMASQRRTKDTTLQWYEKTPPDLFNGLGQEIVANFCISVYGEPFVVEYYTFHPASRLLASVITTADTIPLESEKTALALLAGHATPAQLNMYLLTGSLIHRNDVTGMTYLIRKGFPTLVFESSKTDAEDIRDYRFKVGLCAHGAGYHKGLFTGYLCPTDDVVTHLLMLRDDEDGFWEKSTIHLPTSGRLGI